MSRNMIAGNWKMNTLPSEGTELAQAVIAANSKPNCKVVFGVPAVQLAQIKELTSKHDNYFVAAQNCHHEDSGAYTGEISAPMLADLGIDYVILGHSERRDYFGENDELIAKKVRKVLDNGMLPIYCCGEKLDVREAGNHEVLVGQQIKTALFDLSAEDFGKVVIAYEPVWAIGTGVTASPEQAQDMHAYIREIISVQYGKEVAARTTILYGGSMKPANAADLIAKPDVDGGLVGGASLKAELFKDIVAAG
ncbi:triose-phosphate isomerase [Lewinellaceae bacterium SD302]|nr:triose-phosphate isomerase [Lewinellaceae bacterium SD302]